MSEATIEALESEAYEGEGEAYEGEAYEGEAYEGEAYGEAGYEGEAYGEASRADLRRRQARQRQIAAARQRQARLRRPPAPPPRRPAVTAPSPRQAMTAIRSLDLDTKAEVDSLRRQLAKARRNGDMAMYSAVLSALASQGIDTFGDRLEKHDVVKGFFRTAPLALLWPQHGRKGIEGILLHPAFVGAAGIAAIVISGKLVNASHEVNSISVDGPDQISTYDGPKQLSAVASDRKGNPVTVDFTWTSTDTTTATVDSTGLVTGVKAGGVHIEARGGGATGRKFVTIVS